MQSGKVKTIGIIVVSTVVTLIGAGYLYKAMVGPNQKKKNVEPPKANTLQPTQAERKNSKELHEDSNQAAETLLQSPTENLKALPLDISATSEIENTLANSNSKSERVYFSYNNPKTATLSNSSVLKEESDDGLVMRLDDSLSDEDESIDSTITPQIDEYIDNTSNFPSSIQTEITSRPEMHRSMEKTLNRTLLEENKKSSAPTVYRHVEFRFKQPVKETVNNEKVPELKATTEDKTVKDNVIESDTELVETKTATENESIVNKEDETETTKPIKSEQEDKINQSITEEKSNAKPDNNSKVDSEPVTEDAEIFENTYSSNETQQIDDKRRIVKREVAINSYEPELQEENKSPKLQLEETSDDKTLVGTADEQKLVASPILVPKNAVTDPKSAEINIPLVDDTAKPVE